MNEESELIEKIEEFRDYLENERHPLERPLIELGLNYYGEACTRIKMYDGIVDKFYELFPNLNNKETDNGRR